MEEFMAAAAGASLALVGLAIGFAAGILI